MKQILINISIVALLIVPIVFSGCSGQNNPDEVKAKLMDKCIGTDYDTVRRSIQFSTINTFEEAVQQSLIDKDFVGATPYLDTSVLFVIVLKDKSMQKFSSRESVINGITNILQSLDLIDYAFYASHPESEPESTLYNLSLKALYNGEETNIGIMFLMRNEIITAIKLY